MEKAVKEAAARDRISRAGKVTELLRIALEIEEDSVWDELAKKRDVRDAKFVPHKKAWR
jgi:hypothetical protein